jgi:hypothetical protein
MKFRLFLFVLLMGLVIPISAQSNNSRLIITNLVSEIDNYVTFDAVVVQNDRPSSGASFTVDENTTDFDVTEIKDQSVILVVMVNEFNLREDLISQMGVVLNQFEQQANGLNDRIILVTNTGARNITSIRTALNGIQSGEDSYNAGMASNAINAIENAKRDLPNAAVFTLLIGAQISNSNDASEASDRINDEGYPVYVIRTAARSDTSQSPLSELNRNRGNYYELRDGTLRTIGGATVSPANIQLLNDISNARSSYRISYQSLEVDTDTRQVTVTATINGSNVSDTINYNPIFFRTNY